MWTRAFWAATLERAIKSAAQAVLNVWLIGDVVFDILTVNWELSIGVALGGFALSILTSLVSSPFGPPASPSFSEAR